MPDESAGSACKRLGPLIEDDVGRLASVHAGGDANKSLFVLRVFPPYALVGNVATCVYDRLGLSTVWTHVWVQVVGVL